MLWFERLVGFEEQSPEHVRQNLYILGNQLHSRKNGKSYQCGTLSIPSLAELRTRTSSFVHGRSPIAVQELIANVQDLHRDPCFHGAVFQVASQFNLLEMSHPRVTPEQGVGIYEFDRTQGPACAIACGAGTIFRNYFAVVDGHVGQEASRQIDCLKDLGQKLGNRNGSLWALQNGYVLATASGLRFIRDHLRRIDDEEYEELLGLIRIGAMEDTEVTLANCDNRVTQLYCSAVPVAYSNHSDMLWAPFAKLVLEAAYESTLRAALLNRERTGSNVVFLTLLGGGMFGNHIEWIVDAMGRAIALAQNSGLEVKIVSYREPCAEIRRLLTC